MEESSYLLRLIKMKAAEKDVTITKLCSDIGISRAGFYNIVRGGASARSTKAIKVLCEFLNEDELTVSIMLGRMTPEVLELCKNHPHLVSRKLKLLLEKFKSNSL